MAFIPPDPPQMLPVCGVGGGKERVSGTAEAVLWFSLAYRPFPPPYQRCNGHASAFIIHNSQLTIHNSQFSLPPASHNQQGHRLRGVGVRAKQILAHIGGEVLCIKQGHHGRIPLIAR